MLVFISSDIKSHFNSSEIKFSRNFVTFRSLIFYLAPCTFPVPAKTLEDPSTKQQGFYLGSWW